MSGARSAPRPSDTAVLQMVGPLAGFSEHQRFRLISLDDEGTVCRLHATDRPDLSFLVMPPHVFFPDYAPVFDDTVMNALELHDLSDLLLLVLVHPGDTLADTTVNLLAPLVVNSRTGRAAQLVVTDLTLPMRAPLVAA